LAIIELSERVAVIPGGVNVGVIRGDGNRCILVDTGLHETSAKKVIKAVREDLGGDVTAILITHAHADHFGGNATVVKRTGAKVYAPAFDEAVLRYPLLQPALLFAGADPPPTMRGGFMLADASPVDVIVEGNEIEIEGVKIRIESLKGHSPNQFGYVLDGVFFCADVVLPESILDKYKIPYLFSLTDHLLSLERATEVECSSVVPGHGPLLESIRPVRDANRELTLNVIDRVLEFTSEPTRADEVLARLLRHFGATAADAPSFYVLQPTVYAFLAHLQREGKMENIVGDGESRWRAV
jgi:glyoxylase-like metal-dependent hydrolase (beta-lactamase superfamily II)